MGASRWRSLLSHHEPSRVLARAAVAAQATGRDHVMYVEERSARRCASRSSGQVRHRRRLCSPVRDGLLDCLHTSHANGGPLKMQDNAGNAEPTEFQTIQI